MIVSWFQYISLGLDQKYFQIRILFEIKEDFLYILHIKKKIQYSYFCLGFIKIFFYDITDIL